MASSLLGADYTVQWSDFAVRTTPPAGDEGFDARIFTHAARTGGTVISMSSVASFFTIRDDLTLRVSVAPTSWRLSSASSRTGKEQVWLIKHEQGHYDIHALLARDFYWRVRGMMGVPFTSTADIAGTVQDHAEATIGNLDQLNQDYDNDTKNSRDGEEQWSWWCAMQRARQLHRTPLEKNADGQLLRIELMAALRAAGLTG